jgi:branched-chain amino acid transport system substrate-binding protein
MKWFASAAAAALLSLSAGVASAADVVKVGLIADYTGAFAMWGTQFQQAIEAFQATHGKTVKGPDGKEIEIQYVYRDATSAGPEKSKQLAEELVLREKVKFLAGFDLSPQAMAVADIATQAKIPSVIMNAATASITRGSPYFVRVSMTIPQHGTVAGRWAAKNGIKTAITAVSDYAPGYDAETYFTKEFTAGGGKVIDKMRMPQQETNYATYMEKVLQAKPDALFMFLPAGSPSIAFVKAYIERGLKAAGIKLIGTGETQQVLLQSLPDEVVGTVTGFHYTETNKNPENLALKDALTKKFGDKAVPDIASVAAWDGTNLIYQAVAALGPNADGIKYIEFMKGKKLNSPRGPIEIDPETRDIIQNLYVREVRKVDGKLVNIDIAQENMMKDPWKIDNPEKK